MTGLPDMAAMAAETLHPDLAPYLVPNGPLGAMLKHPLVYDMTAGVMPGMANRAYAQKSAALAKAIASDDYLRAIWFYERPYRLPMLWEWWQESRLGLPALRVLLMQVWIDTEFPHQFGATPLRLFKAAGFTTDDPAGWERQQRAIPLALYRGGGRSRRRLERTGLSWTTDLGKAQWFASRFGRRINARTQGVVWRGTLEDASKALGYFTRRNEDEVVVRAQDLGGLAIV